MSSLERLTVVEEKNLEMVSITAGAAASYHPVNHFGVILLLFCDFGC
jgi:hypothetical protein